MYYGNPFYEEIRHEVNREAQDIRSRVEQIAEDSELSEAEIDSAVNETVKRIRSALHHTDQTTETLPALLANLTWLASEWNYRETQNIGPDSSDKESLQTLLYSTAQMTAQDEANKVQFILETYSR